MKKQSPSERVVRISGCGLKVAGGLGQGGLKVAGGLGRGGRAIDLNDLHREHQHVALADVGSSPAVAIPKLGRDVHFPCMVGESKDAWEYQACMVPRTNKHMNWRRGSVGGRGGDASERSVMLENESCDASACHHYNGGGGGGGG